MADIQRTLTRLHDTFRDRAKAFQQEGQGRKAAKASARHAIEQDRQVTVTQERQHEIAQTLGQNRTAELCAWAELGPAGIASQYYLNVVRVEVSWQQRGKPRE